MFKNAKYECETVEDSRRGIIPVQTEFNEEKHDNDNLDSPPIQIQVFSFLPVLGTSSCKRLKKWAFASAKRT